MFSLLKRIYLASLIFLHYRTFNPQCVRLVRCKHRVAVDPRDKRARKKLIADGLRNRFPRNQQFWRAACTQLRPAVALDIGANYGECLFSVDYAPTTRAIGVEANPELRQYLEESRRLHDSCAQIDVYTAIIDESSGRENVLYIDRFSSGGSTASRNWRNRDPRRFKEVYVSRICVDDLLTQVAGNFRGPIVFKIDVEGYEAHALRGMRQTLAGGLDAIGFIEFDLAMLAAAGSDPREFWEFLHRHFTCFLFIDRNHCQPTIGKSLANFRPQLNRRRGHTDMLLVHSKSPEKYAEFIAQWAVERHRKAA